MWVERSKRPVVRVLELHLQQGEVNFGPRCTGMRKTFYLFIQKLLISGPAGCRSASLLLHWDSYKISLHKIVVNHTLAGFRFMLRPFKPDCTSCITDVNGPPSWVASGTIADVSPGLPDVDIDGDGRGLGPSRFGKGAWKEASFPFTLSRSMEACTGMDGGFSNSEAPGCSRPLFPSSIPGCPTPEPVIARLVVDTVEWDGEMKNVLKTGLCLDGSGLDVEA